MEIDGSVVLRIRCLRSSAGLSESADFPDIGYTNVEKCGEMDEQYNTIQNMSFFTCNYGTHLYIYIWINFRFAFANYGGYIYIYS